MAEAPAAAAVAIGAVFVAASRIAGSGNDAIYNEGGRCSPISWLETTVSTARPPTAVSVAEAAAEVVGARA